MVNAVDRALGLLAAFHEPGARFTLAELSRREALPPSTALRLLRTLEAAGYLTRDAEGRFEPGPTLVRLATATIAGQPLRTLAGPALERLAAQTGETANLAVRHGADEVLYLRQVPSAKAIRYESWAGRTVPRKGTAIGAALSGRVNGEGYAVSHGVVEPDVSGVAAPIPGSDAALSVIGPTYRMPAEVCAAAGVLLVEEAARLAAQ